MCFPLPLPLLGPVFGVPARAPVLVLCALCGLYVCPIGCWVWAWDPGRQPPPPPSSLQARGLEPHYEPRGDVVPYTSHVDFAPRPASSSACILFNKHRADRLEQENIRGGTQGAPERVGFARSGSTVVCFFLCHAMPGNAAPTPFRSQRPGAPTRKRGPGLRPAVLDPMRSGQIRRA
jgi:hypothetical protein